MSSMRATTTVGELIGSGALQMSDGYRTKRSELSACGYRIVRAADIRGGAVALDSDDFVSVERSAQIGEKAGRAGDVILTTKGTVGRVAIMPETSELVVYSPQLCFFRVLDSSVIDRRYLSFWLRTPAFWQQARDRMGNSDMAPYINLTDVRSLEVDLPGIDEQRAIAEVLGALDDKIAANDAVTRGADKLGRAFFAALPKDELAPLSSVAQFVNGKAFTKNATGTGRVVVRIAELNSGIGGSTVYNDIEVSEQHLARPGDILFAWSGSLTLHRWYRDEAIVNQHIFKVIPHEGRPPWLVWDLIASKLEEFRAIAADKATTMGHIQRRHLDEPVRIPTAEVIAQSNAKMTALWDRALAAERENLALAATRDSLLLGLMSGKLRVRDAEGVLDRLV